MNVYQPKPHRMMHGMGVRGWVGTSEKDAFQCKVRVGGLMGRLQVSGSEARMLGPNPDPKAALTAQI